MSEDPASWPDNETVRNDMLNYAQGIEYGDKYIGEVLRLLEEPFDVLRRGTWSFRG